MEDRSVDLGRVLAILRDRWKIVVAIAMLVVGTAYAYVTVVAQPVYEAAALVTYQAPRNDSNPTGGVMPSSGLTASDIQTLIGNATSPPIVEAAATKAGTDADTLRRSVQVRPRGDASLVDFVSRADDPEVAATRANAWAAAFVADRQKMATVSLSRLIRTTSAQLEELPPPRVNDLYLQQRTALQIELTRLESDRELWTKALSVSNQAQAPAEAIWPRTTLTLVAAALIGLALGSGIALLTARVDHRLHGDAFDELPAPVLVRVPSSPRASKSAPLGPAMAEPVVADAFAALGARVMLDAVGGEGAHVILVTSARAGEGKSSVAANLASALAVGGRRVVLVDADLRRPTQDIIFPTLQGRAGLSQVLTRGAELESALALVAPNLAAVASGPRQSNASMLLASLAMRQLLERLSQVSDVVVVDAPPVLAVNDALAVAPAADQVLLCARVGISDVGEIEEAHRRVTGACGTPQAMVLVGTERPTGYGYDQELRTTAPPAATSLSLAAPAALQHVSQATAPPPSAGPAPPGMVHPPGPGAAARPAGPPPPAALASATAPPPQVPPPPVRQNPYELQPAPGGHGAVA